jgi:hypothetical protein
MSLRVLRCERTFPLALSLALLFSLLSVSHADALVEYGGRGIGVRAVVANGQEQTIANTGELPAAGGTLSDSVASAAISGLLDAGVIDADITGAANQTQTDASITDLAVALPGLAIGVDLLQSHALASCNGTTASVSGGATIVGLLLNGAPIVVNGTPNQTIALPLGLGQIVLNQQIALASGSVGTIEVNALRLQVPSLGIDVALASSRAEISCDVQTSCTAPFLYSGRATVVDATVLGERDLLVDTGPLPSQGGVLQSSLIVANLPPLLSAATLAASTTGSAGQSASDATIANVALTVAGLGISADVVTSMAEAACTAGGPTASGDSVVLNLVIAGNVIPITGNPNQVVALPLGLGQIVINEQVSTINAGAAAIDVAALHVIVTGIADIAISRTHADVTCVPLTRTFSGRGVIAQVTTTIPPLVNTIGDTGFLPAQGGSLSSTLPNISLPGILTTGLIQSSTSGAGNQSTANTSLATVGLLAGLVQANIVQSNATATCTGNTASVAGGSQIANLTVAGLPIIVSGAPNQTIPLIVGSLVLNEQTGGAAGSTGDLTVNALHLKAAGVADVVLGSSHADIQCQPNALPPCPTPVAPTPTPVGPTPTPTPVGPTPSPTPHGNPTPTPTPVPTAHPTPTAPLGPPQPTANICHHNCPDKIRLSSGIDSLDVKSGFPLSTQLDPANEGFRIVLRNANGVIYQATLLPGDLRLKGKKFLFTDKAARRGTGIRGGLARVEISSAGGGVGTRVNVEAFGDLSAATLSTMTVEITVGNDAIAYTQPWEQKPYGWYLAHR